MDNKAKISNHHVQIEGDEVKVYLTEIQDLIDSVKVMDDFNIKKCKVSLRGVKNVDNDLIFQDYISYLEDLYNKGYAINFYYQDNFFPLKKIIDDEKMLNLVTKEINNSDLSQLEKFIAVYDIVYLFKPYLEEDKNESLHLSRSLYEFLNNNYMVCAGYANLLSNLCKRVGIPCKYFGVELKDSFHARNYIYIDDPKYSISGYYVCDSTASENVNTIDKLPVANYNKLLMTTNEHRMKENYVSDDAKFFCMSKEEFLSFYHNSFTRKYLLSKFMLDFDEYFYDRLQSMDFNNESDILEAYDYIQGKINKSIPQSTILRALMEEKKFIFKDMEKSFFDDLELYYARVFFPNVNITSIELIDSITLKELKKQYPINYLSFLFDKLNDEYLITDGFINYDIQNIVFLWSKDYGVLKGIVRFDNNEILNLEEYLIELGYTINFKDREAVIIFPHVENEENLTIKEYFEALCNQKDEFIKIYTNGIGVKRN